LGALFFNHHANIPDQTDPALVPSEDLLNIKSLPWIG
jgi:hypothetical protein